MTYYTPPDSPAIGACLSCNSLFLIQGTNVTCILCGQPPAFTLPFSPAPVGAPLAASPETPPEPVEGPATLIGVTCPHCAGQVQLSITDTEITVLPPPPPPTPEEEPIAEALLAEPPLIERAPH